MKKDIEKYINDSINAEAPPSLAKEVIVSKLGEQSDEGQAKKRRSRQYVIKFASVAAALVMVMSGAFLAGSLINQKNKTPSGASPEIFAAEDYSEVYAKLKEIRKNNSSNSNVLYGILEDKLIAGAAPEASAAVGTDEAAAVKSENTGAFGTTNVQENGIDEGDIIKTDGKNIFLADKNNDAVYVVSAKDGKTEKLSEIKIGGDVYIQEIYLSGNTLAVIYNEYDRSKQTYSQDDSLCICGGYPYEWYYTETKLNVYDTSDPEKVSLISSCSQSGSFISSRLKDGKLYLISSYCVDVSAEDYKKYGIPETSENGVNRRIPAEKISIIKDTDSPTFAVISTFDIASAKKTDASAIFGDPSNVYMSENALYLIENKYDGENYSSYLNIVKFRFTETGVKYLASAKADGYLNSNLSMSEYGGNFRIATTCQLLKTVKRANGKGETVAYDGEINKLYIFNEKMEQEGIIDGFAKNEQIRSARYIGNYAYIVTFRRTDPLFVINLSDPKNPVIESELKLPGFSSYLHPIGEGLLAGIGNDGDENNANGNMKVSLFSVIDPKNPKELSAVKVGNKDDYVVSNVFYSYKAFVSLPNGEFAVPLSLNYSRNQMFIRYKVSDGAVSEVARYELGDSATEIIGGTYIGNYFYAFSSEFIDGKTSNDVIWKARITSFDMTSHSQISATELA